VGNMATVETELMEMEAALALTDGDADFAIEILSMIGFIVGNATINALSSGDSTQFAPLQYALQLEV
jgi:hypothetical protein